MKGNYMKVFTRLSQKIEECKENIECLEENIEELDKIIADYTEDRTKAGVELEKYKRAMQKNLDALKEHMNTKFHPD